MVKTYDAEEARAQFSKLLELAHRGQTTLVTRDGKPYAVVAPVDYLSRKRVTGGLLGLRGSGKNLWGSDPARTVRGVRDDWA